MVVSTVPPSATRVTAVLSDDLPPSARDAANAPRPAAASATAATPAQNAGRRDAVPAVGTGRRIGRAFGVADASCSHTATASLNALANAPAVAVRWSTSRASAPSKAYWSPGGHAISGR